MGKALDELRAADPWMEWPGNLLRRAILELAVEMQGDSHWHDANGGLLVPRLPNPKEEELNQEAEWAAITELIAAAKDAEMCLRAAPFGGHTVSLRLRKALAALRTTRNSGSDPS